MRLLVLMFSLAMMFLAYSDSALACQCASMSHEQAIRTHQVIIHGRVESQRQMSAGRIVATIEVLEGRKGAKKGDRILVYADKTSSSCGSDELKNGQVGTFALNGGPYVYNQSICFFFAANRAISFSGEDNKLKESTLTEAMDDYRKTWMLLEDIANLVCASL